MRPKEKFPLNSSFTSLVKVFLALLGILFVAETIIMFILLPLLHLHDNIFVENFADSFMLAILSSPFIWMLISRKNRATQELAASEDALRLIYNNVNDAIIIHDLNGDIIDVNDKMLEMYGIKREQACTLSIKDDYSSRDNPLEQLQRLWGKVWAGENQFFEWNARRPHDGSVFNVEVFLRKITFKGKDVILATIRDITARKQADQEQKKLQVMLLHAQKLESIGKMTAGIAHEINTPVQFITTNINFLDEAFEQSSQFIAALLKLIEFTQPDTVTKAQVKVDEEIAHHDWDYLKEEIPRAIGQTKEGLQRVTSIVHAMKEFSHPGSKQKVDSDINQIIKTVLTISKNEWKYVATVDTELDPALPLVPCLANEMGQVFMNLLINAVHAIENQLGENPEGKKGRIILSTRQDFDSVEIRISDTGSGIPRHIQEKIFDPFFTTKAVGKGTGQGLAIAHDVVAVKHNGTLSFETKSGLGTTFIIRLPMGNA